MKEGDDCTFEFASTSYRERTIIRYSVIFNWPQATAFASEFDCWDPISSVDRRALLTIRLIIQPFDHLWNDDDTEKKNRTGSLTVEGNDPSIGHKHWPLREKVSCLLHWRHRRRETNLSARHRSKWGMHDFVRRMLNKHICLVLDEYVMSDEEAFSSSTMIYSIRKRHPNSRRRSCRCLPFVIEANSHRMFAVRQKISDETSTIFIVQWPCGNVPMRCVHRCAYARVIL